MVGYLREVVREAHALKDFNSVPDELMRRLEAGQTLDEIKVWLTYETIKRLADGDHAGCGIASGLLGGVNLVERAIRAEEVRTPVQSEDQWKQEFLDHYYD